MWKCKLWHICLKATFIVRRQFMSNEWAQIEGDLQAKSFCPRHKKCSIWETNIAEGEISFHIGRSTKIKESDITPLTWRSDIFFQLFDFIEEIDIINWFFKLNSCLLVFKEGRSIVCVQPECVLFSAGDRFKSTGPLRCRLHEDTWSFPQLQSRCSLACVCFVCTKCYCVQLRAAFLLSPVLYVFVFKCMHVTKCCTVQVFPCGALCTCACAGACAFISSCSVP